MFRSKLVSSFILGLSLTVALSTAVFAEQADNREVKIQIEQVGGGVDAAPTLAPDTPVSSDAQSVQPLKQGGAAASGSVGTSSDGSVGVAEPAIAVDLVSEAMYQKQSQIDKLLFEVYKAEIEERGITVTSTSATNQHVEIGIIPFNEKNAEYIYQILGKEQIVVVEGIQAVTFSTGVANDEGEEIYTANLYSEDAQVVSATAEHAAAPGNTIPSAAMISTIAAAIIILLGGSVLFTRRIKTARK